MRGRVWARWSALFLVAAACTAADAGVGPVAAGRRAPSGTATIRAAIPAPRPAESPTTMAVQPPPTELPVKRTGIGPEFPTTGPTLPRPAGAVFPGDRPSALPPNVYWATIDHGISPALADVPTRVYVPNSDAHTISVIDPATFAVVDRYSVGYVPHHVTPSWDMTKLYVNNTSGNSLTVIDPRTGRPSETIPVTDPYNLYFTPDGSKAIVVAERLQRLDYRKPDTWELIRSVPIPWSGVDHLDFSADGRYLIASTEFSGQVVKVDNVTMEVVGRVAVGGQPIDVKVSPDGSVFFVANQSRHGVSVIDPEAMAEISFIPTGTGAHGLNYSRDTRRLYVSNRLAGSISVIDIATRQVAETWKVGGSPDMITLSPDGNQLWVSNRFHGSVSVVDTNGGGVIRTIATGAGAHGVCFFPGPGRYSVGHNGVMR